MTLSRPTATDAAPEAGLRLNCAAATNRVNPTELRALRQLADAPCYTPCTPYAARVSMSAVTLHAAHGWDLSQETPALLAEHQLKQQRPAMAIAR